MDGPNAIIEIISRYGRNDTMRFPAFVLSLVTALRLCVQVVAALAEDYPGAGVQKDPPRKYGNISFVEPESKISEPALVPLQLALAAEQGTLQL